MEARARTQLEHCGKPCQKLAQGCQAVSTGPGSRCLGHPDGLLQPCAHSCAWPHTAQASRVRIGLHAKNGRSLRRSTPLTGLIGEPALSYATMC